MEIRYPERGRKLELMKRNITQQKLFGNKIPREGTETLFYPLIEFIPVFNLEIRYPERGRKH